MAKHQLNSRDIEFDFLVLGINCHSDQYRTLTLVNDALGTDFELSQYLPLEWKRTKIFNFSLYHFADDTLGLEYFFIPNLSNFPEQRQPSPGDLFESTGVEEKIRLIRELPQIDYFLVLRGDSAAHYLTRAAQILKTVGEFRAVQVVNPANIPSGKNLFF